MLAYRKFITSSVGLSFVVVGTTGVIFKFFFKNHVLENIHGWLGLAMVLAGSFHIFQNRKSLTSHFRDRRVFALLIPVLMVIVFFALTEDESKHGVNPREVMHKLFTGRASDVAQVFGKDVNLVYAAMKKEGLEVRDTQATLETLAGLNHRKPDAILPYFMK